MLARPPAPPRLLVALRAFAEALFSTDRGPPAPARIDWLMGELRDLLERASTQSRLLLRGALWVVSLVAPLFIGRLGPLRRLPLSERVRALSSMESRSWSCAPVLALKVVLCMLYYEHPDVAREVGYTTPPRALAGHLDEVHPPQAQQEAV